MLKHVQFAAQRSSFVGAAVAADASSSISHAASHATSQTKSEAEAEAPSAQKQMQHSQPATEQLQPAVQLPTPVKQETPVPDVKAASAASNDSAPIEDFTLDKIEQSIADIEAELGWISEPVEPVLAPVPEARNASVTTSSTGQNTG